ncbi:MAG: 1,4-alpha-glucan branching protein GlgB [Fusobacteriaceae bacterium]
MFILGGKVDNKTDIYLFHRGEHRAAYKYLGAHPTEGVTVFRTWAPNAKSVRVIGDFNNWNNSSNFMNRINNEGLWEITIDGVQKGDIYKFAIEDSWGNILEKSDPYAFYSEMRPATASVVYGVPTFDWTDDLWKKSQKTNKMKNSPLNIYEVHLGSWIRDSENKFLNYKELAEKLAAYVKSMNYTHIEIMPVSEHPLDDSWGYQITGYYSVTSRYGTPEDFMYFVNHMHNNNIGVILDWVPGHFCKDSHGLYRFDGQPLYEYNDSRLGENPQWGTCNFDFSRYEVLSFLKSNALYWFREFKIDGIRIDAVANVLYLNFGKDHDFDLKNQYGGDENIEGITFLKDVNYIIDEEFKDSMTFAEDSTAWPFVTKPSESGGLGFTYKWNMGWMNDSLKYIETDPLYRMYDHNKLTFSFMYANAENYCLALSHDEVVHGKKSLFNKMPGWPGDKYRNMRMYAAFMMMHSGKKLNFMGNELAQGLEWRFYESLEWNVLENADNKAYQEYIRSLNKFYLDSPALWELDGVEGGYRWGDSVQCDNTLTFIRQGEKKNEFLVGVFNFSNVNLENYRIPVPRFGIYKEVFNSFSNERLNQDGVHANCGKTGDADYHLNIVLPGLTAVFFKGEFKR